MEQIIKIENNYYKISDETPEIGEEYIIGVEIAYENRTNYMVAQNYRKNAHSTYGGVKVFKIIKKINIIEKFGIFQINKTISNNHESNSIMVEPCYIPYKLDFETLEDALFYKRDLKYSENYIVKSYFI